VTSAASSRDEGRLFGLVILIAEDHPDSLDALRQWLEVEGAEVWAARDGEEAVQQLKLTARLPDVILADLKMPGIDGLELAQRLRDDPRWRSVPIVAVTGRSTMADFHQTLEAGFAAHVAKPIDLEELVVTIQRVRQMAARRAGRRTRQRREGAS